MRIARPIAALAFFVMPALVLAGQGPRIAFEASARDHGKVPYGETVTEEFSFTNVGDETLVIGKVRSGCGCTKAVKGKREIPPGQKGSILVAFDTTGLRAGKKKESVEVHSNDPKHPVVKLTVQADVVREIAMEPPSVAKELPRFVKSVSIPMHVINSSKREVAFKGVTSRTEGMKAHLEPPNLVAPPGSRTPFMLVLEPQKEQERRFYLGQVSLLTDHPRESKTEIRYFLKFNALE